MRTSRGAPSTPQRYASNLQTFCVRAQLTLTKNAYLIDVREPDEAAQGSIPSAVSLPLSTLSSSLHLRGDQFLDKHGFMKPAYDQEIVFYCRSGKRSATASDVARRNGYTEYVFMCRSMTVGLKLMRWHIASKIMKALGLIGFRESVLRLRRMYEANKHMY